MQKQESGISLLDNNFKVNNLAHLIEHKFPVSSRSNLIDDSNKELSQKGKRDLQEKKNVQKSTKWRKKKMGKYQETLLERAKDVLKNNLYEIAELKKCGMWDQLSPGEQKSIKKFTAYIRQKGKNGLSEISEPLESKPIITKEQQNIISNVQISLNELISKELCAAQTFENQVLVMLRQNRQNHLAIFDFLKSLQQEPFEKFFEVLIEVIQAVENFTQQVRLLVGLFGIYNGQKLNPGSDLCCLALKYLAKEDGVTSQQVIGFLKFAFVTNGDLHKAELSDLIQFDRRHKQCFVGFKQWLQWTFLLPPDLTLVLPNSCYILGLPFAKKLQNECNILTKHIPSDFLAIFIQILVFSFEKEEEPFVDFLNVAKNGFLDLVEKIKTTQLLNLFSGLLDQVRLHNSQWYLKISNSRRLIEGALLLVKENKVRLFDNEVCQNLLSEVTNVDQYLVAPSFIKTDTSQEYDGQFKTFLQLNKKSKAAQNFLQSFNPSQGLPEKIMSNFSALQIAPHFIQELAMKIICQKTSTHSFLNIAPGLGKTKLILVAAINFVQTTRFPVIILNSNKTLSDRDFQEATFPLEKLKIPCASVLSQKAIISFSTTQDFVDQKEELPEKYHVLLDEYQNIFFKEEKFFDFVEILKKCESFIGFSGSPLNSNQKKLLENSFYKQTLVLQLTPHTDLGDQETVICKSQVQHVKELSQIAEKFRKDTPQVFILDPLTAAALIKGRKKDPYISLINKEASTVNNILAKLFNKPNNSGQYGTYIINEEMGTGTDFKTSADIECKGGLVLVFGIKPTNTSTFEQLSCRVGRIFNKSRRFYIIHDVNYPGSNQEYLKYQLDILQQKENQEAKVLLSQLNPKQNWIYSEEQSESEQWTENKADVEMQSEVLGQFNNSNPTQKASGHYYSDKNSSNVDESDESFGGQEETEGYERQLQQKQSKDQRHNECNVKKRVKKETAKICAKQNKPQRYKQNKEECKFCGDILIEPHTCNISYNNFVSPLYIKNLDEINEVESSSLVDIEQFIRKKSEIGCEQEHEATFLQNLYSENIGQLSPNGESQLQKKQKCKEKTEMLEQQVRKSLRTQKQEVQIGESKQMTHKDLIDQAYFAGYSKANIHKEMLNDKVRMELYKKAIDLACDDKKIVLDVGSGSGILSAFAVQRGAKEVIAVDNAETKKLWVQDFMKMVELNQIKYIKSTVEDIATDEIPQVDVIISEWMGYFLLFENMVGSYIHSIKKFLKPDGIMIPSKAVMYLNAAAYDTKANKIAKKYLQGSYKVVKIMQCEASNLVQKDPTIIQALDFTNKDLINPLDNGFSSDFQIKIGKQGCFNAFVGSFEVKLYEEVFLNTMPISQQTHWKQSLFFVDNPIQVYEDDIIAGTIKINTDKENYRNLNVKFTYKVEGKGGSQAEECFTFE